MQTLGEKAYDAPADLVQLAKQIMPARNRSVWATLVRTNLSLQGVRAKDPSDIQALFEADGEKIRVQYRSLPKGWELMGNVSAPTNEGEQAGKKFAVDKSGNFHIKVADLDNSGFSLRLEDQEVNIPSILSVIQHDQ